MLAYDAFVVLKSAMLSLFDSDGSLLRILFFDLLFNNFSSARAQKDYAILRFLQSKSISIFTK
jgi:hypothetical protein